MRTLPRSSSRFGTTKPREDRGLVAKLYSDENFPFPAAEELRRLGHDVMTVQESGLGGNRFQTMPSWHLPSTRAAP